MLAAINNIPAFTFASFLRSLITSQIPSTRGIHIPLKSKPHLPSHEKSLERFLSGGFTILRKKHPRLSRALNGQKLFDPENWMTIQGSFQALRGFVLFDFVLTKEGTSQGLPALFIHGYQRFFYAFGELRILQGWKSFADFLVDDFYCHW